MTWSARAEGTSVHGIRGSRLGAGAVVSAVTIWAFTNTLIKLSPLPALTFAVHRVWLGAALLLIVLYASGRRLTWSVIRTSAPGGVLLGLEIAFFFSAVKHTSIADVAMISALQPAFVLLVAGRLFGERVTRREIALASLALVGIGLVIVASSGTPAWSLGGDVLAACSLVCWTVYFLVSKRARATVPTLPYMTVVFVVSAIVITPIVAFPGSRSADSTRGTGATSRCSCSGPRADTCSWHGRTRRSTSPSPRC